MKYIVSIILLTLMLTQSSFGSSLDCLSKLGQFITEVDKKLDILPEKLDMLLRKSYLPSLTINQKDIHDTVNLLETHYLELLDSVSSISDVLSIDSPLYSDAYKSLTSLEEITSRLSSLLDKVIEERKDSSLWSSALEDLNSLIKNKQLAKANTLLSDLISKPLEDKVFPPGAHKVIELPFFLKSMKNIDHKEMAKLNEFFDDLKTMQNVRDLSKKWRTSTLKMTKASIKTVANVWHSHLAHTEKGWFVIIWIKDKHSNEIYPLWYGNHEAAIYEKKTPAAYNNWLRAKLRLIGYKLL